MIGSTSCILTKKHVDIIRGYEQRITTDQSPVEKIKEYDLCDISSPEHLKPSLKYATCKAS